MAEVGRYAPQFWFANPSLYERVTIMAWEKATGKKFFEELAKCEINQKKGC
jgi:hypothetical protein